MERDEKVFEDELILPNDRLKVATKDLGMLPQDKTIIRTNRQSGAI
jgi:hypothetical protein